MIYPSELGTNVLRTRTYRVLAALLSVVLLAVTSYIVPSVASAHDQAPPLPKVLIFPFTNGSSVQTDSSGTALSVDILGNVRLDIDALGYFRSTGFSVLNPSLQRALNVENSIALSDLAAPTATPDRAEKLATIVGTPYFLVGNIDTVTTDPATGTVSIQVDGTLFNTNTGATIKQATVTGTAAPAGKDFDPDQLQASAIANASGQLVAALMGPTFAHRAVQPLPKAREGSSIGKGIIYILAAALALVIINNHGGGHSSSSSSGSSSTSTTTTSTTGPPPPP